MGRKGGGREVWPRMRPRRGRRQIAGCTGQGRRESKWEREDGKDGRVETDGDGEMVRFLYTTLAKQRRPEASTPCLKWWR